MDRHLLIRTALRSSNRETGDLQVASVKYSSCSTYAYGASSDYGYVEDSVPSTG